ncbi:hypothetical protein LCGC14_2277370 [marine sediment metagenome]|uniref:Uncharacterized protein n=1 Tax=marine sediment metagenome TaxID=412755 RepID=A0A0F9DHH7_9ZZZZ
MEVIYLLVCVAGLSEFHIPDICQVYHLRPQYEMTQAEIDSKVIFICESVRTASIAHGGNVDRCEIVEKIPAHMTPIDPVIEELKPIIQELET